MNQTQKNPYEVYHKSVQNFLEDSKDLSKGAVEAIKKYKTDQNRLSTKLDADLKSQNDAYHSSKETVEDNQAFMLAEMNNYIRILGTTLTQRRADSIKKIKQLIEQDALQAVKQLKDEYSKATDQLRIAATQKGKNIEQAFEQEKRTVQSFYARKTKEILQTESALFDENYLNSDLDAPIWDKIQKISDSTPVSHVEVLLKHSKPFSSIQIGTSAYRNEVYEQYYDRKFKILLPFLNQGNLMLQYSGASTALLKNWVNTLTCRLLLANSPKHLHFKLFDIKTIGNAFPLFKTVESEVREIITDKHLLSDQLKKVHQHIQNIATKYLTHHATIEQYNQDAKSGELGYEILIIADFPAAFSEDMLNTLNSILLNGPRAGVNTILLVNKEELPYHTASLKDFDLAKTWASQAQMCTVDLDSRHLPQPVNVLSPYLLDTFSAGLSEKVIQYFHKALEATQKVSLPLENYLLKDNWWQADSSDHLKVPIGLKKTNNQLQYFSFFTEGGDDKGSAAILIGMPGMGKSSLLHTFILNAAVHYSPNELQLYLLDFSGVEFNVYAEHKLPHAKVVAAESDREFGLNVLKGIQREADHREELFVAAGKTNISDYNRVRGIEKVPRIVIIIDEFQKLFQHNDDIYNEVRTIIPLIIQEYRKFGINLILATQTLGKVSIPDSVIGLIGIRVALRSQESESQLVLGSGNKAAAKLKHAGQGIYNARLGREDGNSFFQTFFAGDKIIPNLVKQIKDLVDYKTILPQQTLFRGSSLVYLRDNPAFQDSKLPNQVYPIPVWLGQPMEITHEDASLLLKRQNQQNVLIAGGDEDVALRILSNSVACVVNHHAARSASFIFFNYMGEENKVHFNIPKQYFENIPFDVHFADTDDSLKYLKRVEEIVKDRMKQPHVLKEPIYLTFYNLQGHPRLRHKNRGKELDYFEYILREGAGVGVHVFAQVDTVGNADRVSHSFAENFNHRIAMYMDKSGSQSFINKDYAAFLLDPAKARITRNRALYHNLLRPSTHSKFKPYEFEEHLNYAVAQRHQADEAFLLFPIVAKQKSAYNQNYFEEKRTQTPYETTNEDENTEELDKTKNKQNERDLDMLDNLLGDE